MTELPLSYRLYKQPSGRLAVVMIQHGDESQYEAARFVTPDYYHTRAESDAVRARYIGICGYGFPWIPGTGLRCDAVSSGKAWGRGDGTAASRKAVCA